MEPITPILTAATAIYTVIKCANAVRVAFDDIRSADANIQEHGTEIDLLSAEFSAIYTLLKTATRANDFNDFPHIALPDLETGLVRFQDALKRAGGMITDVKSSQGRLGRLRRAGHMFLMEKEFTKLKDQIESIRSHLQNMLQFRDSYLIGLLAAELLPRNSPLRRCSAGCQSIESSDASSQSDYSDIGSSTPATSRSTSLTNSLFNKQEPMSVPLIYHSDDLSIRFSVLIPPPPPKRSPTLNYRGIQPVDLTRLLPSGFGKKFSLNAISACGELFVLLTKTKFAVVTKTSLVCTGDIQGSNGGFRGAKQSIKTVVLNDEHLFVGTEKRILVFAIRGSPVAKLVCSCDMGNGMMIDKLILSPNGDLLLALVKNGVKLQAAEIYSTCIPSNSAFIPTDKITWKDCKRVHSNATFSADGNKIAIYTSHSQRQSELRFLQKSGQEWIESRNPMLITVISGDPDTQLGDKGITGAAILHNQHVVWSVNSALGTPLHSWCDFDGAVAGASTSPFGRAGSRIIEMSGSNEFNAVVQMDTKGALYFKQHRDTRNLPTLDGVCVPLDRGKSGKTPPPEPRVLTFTKNGKELVLLTGKGQLEVHCFEPSLGG